MPNSSQRNAILVFALFLFLALSFSVFMFINGDFGASRARASDSVTGDYLYLRQLNFEARGQLLGRKLYRASSQQDPYTVSGLKAITTIKFVATNLPAPAQLSFCVQEYSGAGEAQAGGTQAGGTQAGGTQAGGTQAGGNQAESATAARSERQLLCEYRNLERSATAEWSLSLPRPILVGRDADYYCTAELELPLQSEITDLAASSAQLSCELVMKDISNYEELAVSAAVLPLSGGRFLGGEAGSKSSISLFSAATLAGVYTAVAGDSASAEQRLANICLTGDFGRSCAVSFEYEQGQDSLYSPSYREVGMQVSPGQFIDSGCDTQVGRYGRCQQFIQFSWDRNAAVDLFSTGVVDISRLAKPAGLPEQLRQYCETSLPFLPASRGFLTGAASFESAGDGSRAFASAEMLTACQSLLSGK